MNRYKVVKTIGEGSYGQAFLCTENKTHKDVIIKELNITQQEPKVRESSLNEAKILSKLNNHNIVKFIESFIEKGKLYIVMEYAEGGDLWRYIQNRNGRHIPESQILIWIQQLCSALSYVHSQNILHRDLKSRNIFLDSENNAKLGDFGIAKVLEHTGDFAKTIVGSPFYLSPEICNGVPYDEKTDIWSLGCIFYEMCTLTPAFSGNNMGNVVMKILLQKQQPIPSMYSKDLSKLINSMLMKEPSERPNLSQILSLKPLRPKTADHPKATASNSSKATASNSSKEAVKATASNSSKATASNSSKEAVKATASNPPKTANNPSAKGALNPSAKAVTKNSSKAGSNNSSKETANSVPKAANPTAKAATKNPQKVAAPSAAVNSSKAAANHLSKAADKPSPKAIVAAPRAADNPRSKAVNFASPKAAGNLKVSNSPKSTSDSAPKPTVSHPPKSADNHPVKAADDSSKAIANPHQKAVIFSTPKANRNIKASKSSPADPTSDAADILCLKARPSSPPRDRNQVTPPPIALDLEQQPETRKKAAIVPGIRCSHSAVPRLRKSSPQKPNNDTFSNCLVIQSLSQTPRPKTINKEDISHNAQMVPVKRLGKSVNIRASENIKPAMRRKNANAQKKQDDIRTFLENKIGKGKMIKAYNDLKEEIIDPRDVLDYIGGAGNEYLIILLQKLIVMEAESEFICEKIF